MKATFVASLCALGAASALAAPPIFLTPLHVTRQVQDSISGKTIQLEEYGYGNRLVAVRGGRTTIADYEKGELIEIDRDAGTYSITRFDALAKAQQVLSPATRQAATSAATSKAAPVRSLHSAGVSTTKAGRPAEFFDEELDSQSGTKKVSVAVDRTVSLSKDALEVLLGVAYPGAPSDENEVVIAAAAAPQGARIAKASAATASAEPSYALPVEQVVTMDAEGQHAEFRSTVMRVGAEPAPADLVAIPPGARLVTSRTVAAAAEVELQSHPVLPAPRSP